VQADTPSSDAISRTPPSPAARWRRRPLHAFNRSGLVLDLPTLTPSLCTQTRTKEADKMTDNKYLYKSIYKFFFIAFFATRSVFVADAAAHKDN
jgi:hypothetical protein